MNYLSPLAQGLVPYVPGEQPRDRKYIKLNTNENAYPPSPAVAEALRALDAGELRLYPDPECQALRETIARHHGLKVENVFAGNGSDEVLAFAFAALIGPNGAVTPDIGYSFYPVYAQLFGLNMEYVPLDADFNVPLERMICGRTAVLANPNAPTSLSAGRAALVELALALRERGLPFILDEAYCDFSKGDSLAGELPGLDNLLIVRTLSKSHALAGMRTGYALGAPELIDGLQRIRDSFNSYTLDRVAQVAATAAINDEDYFRAGIRRIVATRDRFITELRALGFEVPQSSTNFVFPRHPDFDAQLLFRELRARGILVRYFNKPRLNDRLRITIGTDEDMAAVISAFREILHG